MPEIYSEHNADTVQFFPAATPFPQVTTDDYLRQAAADILAILQEPQKSIPSLEYGSATTNAYIQLAQILKRATKQPTPAAEPRVGTTTATSIASPASRVVTPTTKHTEKSNTSEPLPRVKDKHQVFTRSNGLGRLCPTQSRLHRLVNQALSRNSGYQS